MKWYRSGDVGVSEQHALVLLNYGNGSGAEIVALAQLIQSKVHELFGVELEPEVKYV
jgi:UDP-N-acetylmuramate dehydrogenase